MKEHPDRCNYIAELIRVLNPRRPLTIITIFFIIVRRSLLMDAVLRCGKFEPALHTELG